MALEALLPSEVARLVYGYLLEESCTETAQLFLNESANLHECRSVISHGKTFTTRVSGHALKDILENFCAISSIVQDQVSQLNNLDELKHFHSLVDQIKFLLEDCKEQAEVVKVDASTQITSKNLSELPAETQTQCSCISNNEKRSTKRLILRFDKEVQTETPIYEPSAVQATLLKNLPGYIGNSENGRCQTERSNISKIFENSKKTEIQKANLHETQNEEVIHKNSKQYANSAVQTSLIERRERLDKNVMTDIVEKQFNNYVDTEVQTSEIGSPDSGVPHSVELLGDITLELINNTEIQERIAENINRILEYKKSVYFSNMPTEGTKEESNKSFIAEFNMAVETAFNKTENDPDILDLINEIIQPSDEVTSTEDEVDMEVDNVDEFQENMDLYFEETIPKFENKEAVLVQNEQNQIKITSEQNINNGIYNTVSAESDPIQVEFDSTHSTKYTTDQTVVEKIDINKEGSEVPSNIQNNLEKNASSSLNSAESEPLQQKLVPTTDHFFTHNNTITSTPLKTYTAVQSFDTCDWFSTEALPTPDIDYLKDGTSVFKTNPYTACETVVTTTLISPITSKDTCNIAEKMIVINCSTANALKNQTLNTPDVIVPPKSNFSSIKSPAPALSQNFHLNKDSEIHKSSEIKNDSQILHSTEKANGIIGNSSLSNEKLFGSESIMLYGMENNATTIPTLVNIPEIEVEDSITLTGTELSPFIKINKISKDKEPEITDSIAINATLNEAPNKSINVTQKNQEPSQSTLTSANTIEVITKSTPKVLKQNRPKDNRLSLSTPKKPSSHVRALNFETPAPRSQSESKANEKATGRSPESIMRELKNACKSSLFQSPEITNEEIIEQNGDESVKSKKLKEEKNVNDNKATKQAKVDPIKFTSLKSDSTKVKPIKSKSWDEDLRTMLGQFVEKEKEPSKKSKKKKSKDSDKNKDNSDSKKSKRDKSTPKKTQNSDKSRPKKSKKSDKKTPKKSKSDKKTPKKSKKVDKLKSPNDEKKVNPEQIKIDIENDKKISTAPNSSEEMFINSNRSEDMPIVLNNSEDMPIVSNSSEKIPIVPNSSEEMTMISNSSKDMPIVSNSSEEIPIVPKSSEKMPMAPNSSEEIPIVPNISEETSVLNKPTDEVTEIANDGGLSNSVLEALLSNSMNEDDAISTTDVMRLAAEEMDNLSKLSRNESVSNVVVNTNHDIAEKMQHDEELMTAAFEDTTKNLPSNFSPEKEIEIIDNKIIKPEDVKNFAYYKKLVSQLNAQELDLTPPSSNTSRIITINSSSSQKAEVIYDKVSKIECGRLVQKKYARLQTLDTKIALKSSLNSFAIEVKTPHKDEDTSSRQVPPTPKILSPGNSSSFLTMPLPKQGDEAQMRIRSFVTTPVECPLTPEIVLTPPKTQDENTADALKKTDTSSYFQPTFTTFETIKKSEITQFEVIKENLKGSTPNTSLESEKAINDAPKDEINSENPSNNNPKLLDQIKAIPRHQQRTLSSSSCSSVSCSCCSSSLTSATENYANNNNDDVDVDNNDNNSTDAPSNIFPINVEETKTRMETSPAKVFAIQKTDEELAETVKETPAKDENAVPEMGIVDTPNVSKPAENPTNLNAKISQIMIMKEKAQMEKQQVTEKPKPKIINIQRILPPIITKPSSQFMKTLPLSMQRQTHEMEKESLNRNTLSQRVKIEKTEEEVAQAIESITVNPDFEFNKKLEKSVESVTLSPIEQFDDLDNTQNKIELVKAIQSITNGEINSPVYSPIKSVVDDENEQNSSNSYNSKFEDCIGSDQSQDSLTSKSDQNVSDISANWADMNATCREIYIDFDEENFRRQRRKKFTDQELGGEFCVDHGHVLHYYTLKPSTLECIYNLPPPRKKRGPIVKRQPRFVIVKDDSQESSSTTSSTLFPRLSHNEKGKEKLNVKRKRIDELEQGTVNRKRSKNLNVC